MNRAEAHRILDEARKGFHTEIEITRALWETGDLKPWAGAREIQWPANKPAQPEAKPKEAA